MSHALLDEDHDCPGRFLSGASCYGRRSRESLVRADPGICTPRSRSCLGLARNARACARGNDRWRQAFARARIRYATLARLVEVFGSPLLAQDDVDLAQR